MPVRLVHLAAVAGALLVCAWFALAAVQARSTERAREIVAAPGSPAAADAARAAELLDRAGVLNPGSDHDLVRAQLVLETEGRVASRRVLEEIVAREPDNVFAWSRLAYVTLSTDARRWGEASVQVGRLAPRVPAP